MILIAFHLKFCAQNDGVPPKACRPPNKSPQKSKHYPREGAHHFEGNEEGCSVDGGQIGFVVPRCGVHIWHDPNLATTLLRLSLGSTG